MRGQKFLEKINDIDNDLISEAMDSDLAHIKERKRGVVKLIGLVACIWGVIGVLIVSKTDVSISEKKVGNSMTSVDRRDVLTGAKEIDETVGMEAQSESVSEQFTSNTVAKSEMEQLRYVDLNHDGLNEILTSSISLFDEGNAICTLDVTEEADRKELFKEEFDSSEADVGFYLYHSEDQDSLIRYERQMEQGSAKYQYEVFYFDELGEKVTETFDQVDFETFYVSDGFDVEELTRFYSNINEYLNKSYLIIGTSMYDGVQYSDGDELIRQLEEYKFLNDYNIDYSSCENVTDKLTLYFNFISELELSFVDDGEIPQGVVMTMNDDTLTKEGAEFALIVNDSGNNATCGEPYWIERYDGSTDEWKKLDTINGVEVVFQEIAWDISYGNPMTFSVDWSKYYGQLEAGTYRIAKEVGSEKEIQSLYCQFEIK